MRRAASLFGGVVVLVSCLTMPVLARGGGHGGGGHGGGHAGGHAVAHSGSAHRGGGSFAHAGGVGFAAHGGAVHARGGGAYGHAGGVHAYRGGAYGRGGYAHGYGYGRGYGGGHGYGGYGGGFFGDLVGLASPWFGWGYPYYGDYGYDGHPYFDNGYADYYNGGPVDYDDYHAGIPQTPAVTSAPVRLEVILPDPQAKLWIQDQPTSETGTDRVFQSPPMNLGTQYAYNLRASWTEDGHPVAVERRVNVTPGMLSIVDLSNPSAVTH